MALADIGAVVETTNSGGAVTITVPLNSTVAFPVGTTIDIVRQGTSTVTIAPESTVTIQSRSSFVAISARGEVLDFYDVPRVGLLHQAGQTYYFECIIGDGRRVGFWTYSLLSDSEVQAVLGANGPEESDALTPRFTANRWVTVALAVNDAIVESAVIDAGVEGAMGLADRMLQRWENQRSARESAARLVSAAPSS